MARRARDQETGCGDPGRRAPEPNGGSEATDSLERAAVEWFFRRDGGFTPEEEGAFHRWLREDDRHARAFAEVQGTWHTMGEAQPHVARTVFPPRRPQGRLLRFPVLLAAAAALALFCVALWRTNERGARFAEQAATEIGGLRKIDLPDGSVVMLNTNTAVDVHFSAAERRVRLLRGEALFTVAKSPGRPFIVEASGVAARAVGTAFNVRLRADAVEVLVTEGKVRVDDIARGQSLVTAPEAAAGGATAGPVPERLLVPGERVVIPVRTDRALIPAIARPVPAHEIEQALAWQNRRLEYVDAPLSEIVADFNRYNQHRLIIIDPRLASRRFGGTFPAGDYHSLVQLLETTFGVLVERRERDTVLRLP